MRVAISGAGIAGPTCAYWLRRFGHEPVLFEKAPAARTGGYLIDFWGLGYELAERMGLFPDLLECGYRMQRLQMVDAQGRAVAGMDVAPVRDRLNGRFISLARSDLAAALLKACEGIRCEYGVSIRKLESVTGAVRVTLSDGSQEQFDLVVGADGLHSEVRALAFGAGTDCEKPIGCHVAAFRIPGYARRDELTYVSHTVPKRQVARVALRNDETLVLLVCRSELVGNPAREQQKHVLRSVFGGMSWEVEAILNGMDEADDFYFDRVSQIHLPRWSSDRVALIGDAAACASLLAGEGTGLAMIEAYVLAVELARCAGDLPAALAAYEAQLRGFVLGKQRAALRLRGFFAPASAFTLGVRNWAVNLLAHPFLAKYVVSGALRDDFALPSCTVSHAQPHDALDGQGA